METVVLYEDALLSLNGAAHSCAVRRIKKEDEHGNMALQLVKDMAISHIVQVALDMAKSCLQNGSGLFLGVQNELEKIKDFLEDIHDFIVIAERSPVKDPKLMKLLEILKDAAFDAEDLMEEHAIEDRRRSVEVQNSRPVRDTITNKVLKVVTSLVTPIINRAELAKKLKELSKRLEAIKAKGDTFQLNEKVTNLEIEFKKQRETHSLVNESQVFGREEEKEKIVTLLLSTQLGDEGEHENVSAFVIIGMGGIGKTTLAKLVFNNNSVQNHFKLKMWICVSDNFDIVGLGNEIIQHATGHNPSLSNVEELQCRLRETLSEKRFLLVLDDVWNEEPEKCQRAFGNPTEEASHPNLVPIGREIVKKCDGNPLAVTTLGGLLCFEREGQLSGYFSKGSSCLCLWKQTIGNSGCLLTQSSDATQKLEVEKQLLTSLGNLQHLRRRPNKKPELSSRNKDGVVDQEDNAMKKRLDKGGKASCKKNQSSLRISRDLE
ncbi:hypothetical protein MRB53_009443 [Persea americana]|uniref:Uncharacterized protein n=1 Tax=Persea americana TaxID=3435 RepID=A0ACC2LP44_PERAE|nr:hypothetical protein MRB53_009443 [Persea americana]